MVRRIFSSWALSATRFTTFFSLNYFSFFKKSRLFSLVKTDCVYMINKIIQGCLQIRTFSSRVQLDTKRLWQFILSCSIPHSFAALTHEIASWTLEEKFPINAQSCNILYILNEDKMADFSIPPHAKFLKSYHTQRISMPVCGSIAQWSLVIQPTCNHRLLTTEKVVDECKAIKLVNKCSRKDCLRLKLFDCKNVYCVEVEL